MRARTAADIAAAAPFHVKPFSVFVPIRLVNALNEREHWAVRAGRARMQRRDVRLTVQAAWIGARGLDKPQTPLGVLITRVYPKRGKPFDTDGLAASGKHVRDGVADWLGIDDGDPRIEWIYAQRPGALWGVEILISTAGE